VIEAVRQFLILIALLVPFGIFILIFTGIVVWIVRLALRRYRNRD